MGGFHLAVKRHATHSYKASFSCIYRHSLTQKVLSIYGSRTNMGCGATDEAVLSLTEIENSTLSMRKFCWECFYLMESYTARIRISRSNMGTRYRMRNQKQNIWGVEKKQRRRHTIPG
ncbi:hypothetical protein P3L10_013587 [Capsicum annuum]